MPPMVFVDEIERDVLFLLMNVREMKVSLC